MPQHFFCALALTVTLTTNLTPMTRDNDHRDGSKLTLPRFDPKDPTFFDDLQAYAQDRGLGWLLHADGEDTNDISKYEDMQSDTYKNLKTTGDNATDDDKDKARRWIHDSSVLAGILRRSTHRNPLGRNIIKRALKRDNTDGVHALKKLCRFEAFKQKKIASGKWRGSTEPRSRHANLGDIDSDSDGIEAHAVDYDTNNASDGSDGEDNDSYDCNENGEYECHMSGCSEVFDTAGDRDAHGMFCDRSFHRVNAAHGNRHGQKSTHHTQTWRPRHQVHTRTLQTCPNRSKSSGATQCRTTWMVTPSTAHSRPSIAVKSPMDTASLAASGSMSSNAVDDTSQGL